MTMDHAQAYLIIGIFSLAGLSLVTVAALRAWRGWLDLKLAEMERRASAPVEPTAFPAATRIELADLKERVRRLEAIAAGVDP